MATSFENRHLENVCRLCLTDASEAGDMLPIFPVRGGNPNSPTSVVNRILQCTSLKLEPRDGIPATICELCSVRLEDWYAFREQCLGSDEYLRLTMSHAFSASSIETTKGPSSVVSALRNSTSQPGLTTRRSSADGSTDPSQSSSRSGSLAKRRKSIFQLSLEDVKGNNTGQKVIVEVLDGCSTQEETHQQQSAVGRMYEPIFTPDHDGQRYAVSPELPNEGDIGVEATNEISALQEASWSKEYSARVNSLMLLVNGPRPFKCKICRKLFKARSNLRRHIKVGHSDEIVEAESPPPECYDYGHIHRPGGANLTAPADHRAQQPSEQYLIQPPTNSASGPVKRKRRKTDPPIVGPHRCHLCPRSFKMAAHLAVHMKTHMKVDAVPLPPTQLEQQLQQQLIAHQQVESRRSSMLSEWSRKTDVEPTDVIQLSDDDDEDVKRNDDGASFLTANGHSDELDDGFDEEEGSLKEATPVEPQIELRTNDTSSTTLNSSKIEPVNLDDDDDEDVVIQETGTVGSSPVPKVKPKSVTRPLAPGTIPPGPLSMKQRYRASMENNGVSGKPFSFIVARPKHQSPACNSPTPQTAKPATTTVTETPTAAPDTNHNGSSVTQHRCHFCQQTFPSEEVLRAHQKTHQSDSPFPFRCRWCQKGFRYRQNYTMHVEKQTCRLLSGEGLVQPAGGTPIALARPITANKRSW